MPRFVIKTRLFTLCLSMFFCFAVAQAALLEVTARDLTGQDVKRFGGLVHFGVVVEESTGSALDAGIREGDVIVSINGKEIAGIYDMEQILASIRGRSFQVNVLRFTGQGLVQYTQLSYEVRTPFDLQVRKAFTLKLGYDSEVKAGSLNGKGLLLWHANRVWVYDKVLERERYASLIKVYNVDRHRTHRYPVSDKVIESGFLTDTGLVWYVSRKRDNMILGVLDIEDSPRSRSWHFLLPFVKEDQSYDVKIGDVNGDDIPEVFFSALDTVWCLDGSTGYVIWKRSDMGTYLGNQREADDSFYSDIFVADLNRDGGLDVAVGSLLINAATGEKKSYLSFDPAVQHAGLVEVVNLVGDPMPDVLTKNGLIDGNSGQKVWEPLRSTNYFLADLNGDAVHEMVYLLSDHRLHIHDIQTHRELYSVTLEGVDNPVYGDFNSDGFADLLTRAGDMAFLYQTNIPTDATFHPNTKTSMDYAGILLDFGLQKDRFFLVARELYHKGDVREAVPIFLRARAANADRAEIDRYLTFCYIKLGDIESALALLRGSHAEAVRQVLQGHSSEVVMHLLERNQISEAIRFLEMENNDDPVLLARCYLAMGRPEVAVKLLRGMENRPASAELVLARAYILAGKSISARVALENYLAVFPDEVEGWLELGQLEMHEQNWKAAEKAFKRSLDIDPIRGHLFLSSLYLQDSPITDKQQSLRHARRALALEDSTRTRLQMAEVLVELGEFEGSAESLKKVDDPGLELSRYERLRQKTLYHLTAREKFKEAEKLIASPVFKKRNAENAEELLLDILRDYSAAEVVDEAHLRLADLYTGPILEDPEKAEYHFRAVIALESEYRKLAEEGLRKLLGKESEENYVPLAPAEEPASPRDRDNTTPTEPAVSEGTEGLLPPPSVIYPNEFRDEIPPADEGAEEPEMPEPTPGPQPSSAPVEDDTPEGPSEPDFPNIRIDPGMEDLEPVDSPRPDNPAPAAPSSSRNSREEEENSLEERPIIEGLKLPPSAQAPKVNRSKSASPFSMSPQTGG